MKLSSDDVVLYHDLIRSLMVFSNDLLEIMPSMTADEWKELTPVERSPIQDQTWENPQVIDLYVADNPDSIDAEQLEIIVGFKQSISGRFTLERYLKKHAIFIAEDNRVYGVSGISEGFDELIDKSWLPLPVRTTLLPFKGKIIYHGLMGSYNIHYGRGIRDRMKDTYMRAKHRGEIITTFDQGAREEAAAKRKSQLKNWTPALDTLAKNAKSLRAQSISPPTWSPAFSLIKASIEMAKIATETPDDQDRLWKQQQKIEKIVAKLETGVYRS